MNVFDAPWEYGARLLIIGVGPWGCEALNAMRPELLELAKMVAVDTDPLTLEVCCARTKILVEEDWATWMLNMHEAGSGYGTIQKVIAGADLVFLLGNPLETNLSGLLVEMSAYCVAQEILTVPVCPVSFLAKHDSGLAKSAASSPFLPVPMVVLLEKDWAAALCYAICSVILEVSCIGIDFADVRTVLGEPGFAFSSIGEGVGNLRAHFAGEAVFENSAMLAEAAGDARAILVVIMLPEDSVSLDEFTTVGEWINRYAAAEATVVIGIVHDALVSSNEMKLFVLATGLDGTVSFSSKQH